MQRSSRSQLREQEERLVPLQAFSTVSVASREPLLPKTTENLSILELLGLYDRVSFARLIEEGFAFRVDVKSETESLSRNDEARSLKERISSIGEEEILHLVLSPNSSFSALVTRDARIEIWREDILAQDWVHHRDVQVPDAHIDEKLRDSLGKFFVREGGETEFVFLHPEAEGVVATWVVANTGVVSSSVLPLAVGSQCLKTLKITENARRALAVFEDRSFAVLKLDDRELSTGLIGRFTYPCFFDNFIKEHIQQTCIHISEDCRSLTTGWDFSKGKMITFSLNAGDAKMHDEYVNNCSNQTRTNIGIVSWMNLAGGRAIVHRKAPGRARLLLYDTFRLHGAVLKEMPCPSDRDEAASPPFEWMTEFNPGNPADLRFFCMRVLLYNQETPPEFALLNLFRVHLDESVVQRLLWKFGVNSVNADDPDEKSMLHYAVIEQNLDSGELLFNVAADEDIAVQMSWNAGDILGWAIERGSYQCLMLILERLVGRCSTVTETSHLLSVHFDTLVKKFPHLVDEYLMNDKFCFEYGRFSVPMHAFVSAKDKPIAMITGSMDSWTAASSEEAKRFWTVSDRRMARRLNDISDLQVTAVSKFICLDDVAWDRKGDLLHNLVRSRLPVEVFDCQFVRTVVQWKWHTAVRIRLFIAFSVHFVAAISFSVFASSYGLDNPDDEDGHDSEAPPGSAARGSETAPDERQRRFEEFVIDEDGPSYTETDDEDWRISRWSLRFAVALLCGLTLFGRVSISRLLSAISRIPVIIILLWVIFARDNNPTIVFLTSFQCITLWISVLFYLQPLATTGPLVSMIRYVVWDTLPFATLGLLAIIGFGMAFYVLFNALFDGKDGGNFSTQPRSFETMFYGAFGEFDREVMLQSSKRYPFLSIWVSVLFVIFVFLGGIVLLSLLIAILGDTYDRVKMTERAELIKVRARVIGAARPRRFSGWLMKKIIGCFSCYRRHKHVANQRLLRHVSGGLVQPRGKCFHFLVPAEPIVDTTSDTWPGKILASVRMIKTKLHENENRFAKELKKLNDTVCQTQRRTVLQAQSMAAAEHPRERIDDLADRVGEMDNRLGRIEDSLSLILRKLDGDGASSEQ